MSATDTKCVCTRPSCEDECGRFEVYVQDGVSFQTLGRAEARTAEDAAAAAFVLWNDADRGVVGQKRVCRIYDGGKLVIERTKL